MLNRQAILILQHWWPEKTFNVQPEMRGRAGRGCKLQRRPAPLACSLHFSSYTVSQGLAATVAVLPERVRTSSCMAVVWHKPRRRMGGAVFDFCCEAPRSIESTKVSL